MPKRMGAVCGEVIKGVRWGYVVSGVRWGSGGDNKSEHAHVYNTSMAWRLHVCSTASIGGAAAAEFDGRSCCIIELGYVFMIGGEHKLHTKKPATLRTAKSVAWLWPRPDLTLSLQLSRTRTRTREGPTCASDAERCEIPVPAEIIPAGQ